MPNASERPQSASNGTAHGLGAVTPIGTGIDCMGHPFHINDMVRLIDDTVVQVLAFVEDRFIYLDARVPFCLATHPCLCVVKVPA